MRSGIERLFGALTLAWLAIGAAASAQELGESAFVPTTATKRYDEVGYALILPAGRDRATAGAITGGSDALPLESFVEVTAIESGRTILLRLTDRLPQGANRLIALSPGAADQLGVMGEAAPAVRVRRVDPPEQERGVLRAGRRAAERLPAPVGLRNALRALLPPAPGARPAVAPAPAVAAPDRKTRHAENTVPAATPEQGGFAVQVAAFGSRAKADALAKTLGGFVVQAGAFSRVRTGPYPSAPAARAAIPPLRAKGYADARVVVNEQR